MSAVMSQSQKITFPVNTPPATLCFPNLFVPRAPAAGAEPRFSCILLFDEEAQKLPAYLKLRQAVFQVIEEKFPSKAKEMVKSLRLPFRDAGEKDYNGFEAGMIFINPWASEKREIIDRNGQLVLVPGDVFAGQLVRAAVHPFYYDNSGNRGVSFGLDGIQIIDADKPRLDGRVTSAKKMFNDGLYAPDDTSAAGDELPF
jgi:hypothetical protein